MDLVIPRPGHQDSSHNPKPRQRKCKVSISSNATANTEDPRASLRVQLPNGGPCSVITEQPGLGIISWIGFNRQRSPHDSFSAGRLRTGETFILTGAISASLGIQRETVSTHKVDNHVWSRNRVLSDWNPHSKGPYIRAVWWTVMIRWHGTGALISKNTAVVTHNLCFPEEYKRS